MRKKCRLEAPDEGSLFMLHRAYVTGEVRGALDCDDAVYQRGKKRVCIRGYKQGGTQRWPMTLDRARELDELERCEMQAPAPRAEVSKQA